MFDFVAIDFETATESMKSACSVGIVGVKDLVICERFYSLIRPPYNSYRQVNIGVHGIQPESTQSAPLPSQLWPDISRFFDIHTPVVAHNAHFDMSVLRSSFTEDIPNFFFFDTMDFSKLFYFPTKGLIPCAVSLGIDVDGTTHHNALDDAEVCAKIAIRAFQELGCKTAWEFLAKHIEIPRMRLMQAHRQDHSYSRSRVEKIRTASYGRISPKDIIRTVDSVNPESELNGKCIVFTGELTMERAEAMQLAVNSGAVVRSSVSSKTDYVVVGAQDLDLVGMDGLSSKQEKAIALNEAGKAHIEFLNEAQFIKMAGQIEKEIL